MDVKATITKASQTGNKKYVEYHILVQLPFRKYVVKKRYSEFVGLAKDMKKDMCTDDFPFEIPPKTYSCSGIPNIFSNSSINDNELLGFRTQVFNKLLLDIISDLLWRRCRLFIEFLELPSSVFDDFDSQNGAEHMYMKRELNINDENDWMEIMRECKSLVDDPTVKNVTIVRTRLNGLKQALETFGKDLEPDEYNRRQMLLSLVSKELSIRDGRAFNNNKYSGQHGNSKELDAEESTIEGSSSSITENPYKSRMRIFGSGDGGIGDATRPAQETEFTRNMNDKELLTVQQHQIKSQDDTHLASLYETIKKQKQIGMIINDELGYHNSILDEISNGVDSTGNKVKIASEKTQKMNYSL